MANFLGKTLQRTVTNDDDNSKELKRYGSSSVNEDGNSNRNICPKKKCYRKFAVGYSTERHFRIGDDEEPGFYGAYGHVRKELDYTYHEHYRKGTDLNKVHCLVWFWFWSRLTFVSALVRTSVRPRWHY